VQVAPAAPSLIQLRVVPPRPVRPGSASKPVWGAGANVASKPYRSTSAKCVAPRRAEG
jgi:hypothetical protein